MVKDAGTQDLEIEALRARLAEAEDTLEAIRSGRVDALVVRGPQGDRVYTIWAADRTFREMAERMSDGAATISDDGTILWANRQLGALLARPLEKLMGENVSVLVPPSGKRLQRLLEAERGSEQTAEVEVVRADGSLVPVRLSVQPVSVEDAAARAVVVADLTEHRRTEALLRQWATDLERRVQERTTQLEASRRQLDAAEDKLRRLLEAVTTQMPIGVIVAEPGGRIVYQNQEAARIWAALPIADRLPDREAPPDGAGRRSFAPHESALLRALDGKHVGGTEITVEQEARRPVVAVLRADPIRDDRHEVVAAVCVVSDITASREAEAIRDAFIDVTAHELKTPLTTIFGAVQTLQAHDREIEPDVRRELVDDAAAETLRLIHLVDDMLVLSRVERGVDFVIDEPVLLEHVARRVVEAEARRGGVSAILRPCDGSVPVVSGERIYVEQILDNMLRNAGKYGRPPVEVEIETQADGVAVRVLDKGPGFTSDPNALFDLFYREPTARRRASGGGIGLFVCRELARMMGGRVWAVNRPEGGAEFGFCLPIYAEEDEG